ncbi:MAG: hypothetical protein M1813_007258 [Trichoglossum hirsutum]|nr:MAG: hypothetical protein M1813_007258 [Trichoglossum hirsutum]
MAAPLELFYGSLIFADNTDGTIKQKIQNRAVGPPEIGPPDVLVDFLQKMLVFEPGNLKSAKELLQHPWLGEADVHPIGGK